MKLIIINRHDTDDTEKVTESVSDGHRYIVNSVAPEPMNGYEPKLTQIFPIVGPQTC